MAERGSSMFQNWCVYAADFGSTVSTWCVYDARLKLPGAFMMLDFKCVLVYAARQTIILDRVFFERTVPPVCVQKWSAS